MINLISRFPYFFIENYLKFLFYPLIMNSCPECGSEKLELTNEGLVCKKCGLVIEETYYSGKRIA
ncbi:MAG: hypothetical protein DRP00_01705 [Candidatus Aenigmatarchaeota archaeon]|nr:MAG: hypothetical protein DRP00_01705 [Candidatus Aenigmarchaeota archaeon]